MSYDRFPVGEDNQATIVERYVPRLGDTLAAVAEDDGHTAHLLARVDDRADKTVAGIRVVDAIKTKTAIGPPHGKIQPLEEPRHRRIADGLPQNQDRSIREIPHIHTPSRHLIPLVLFEALLERGLHGGVLFV